ncbi:MAG: DUF7134 domain-containing protein, partial [Dermatophilaceae bacterium]
MGQRGDRVMAAALLLASCAYVVVDGTIAILPALALAVAQVAPLPWARRRPALVLGLVLVTFTAHIVLLPEFLPADLALLVAAFGVVVACGWWPAGIGAIVGAAAA